MVAVVDVPISLFLNFSMGPFLKKKKKIDDFLSYSVAKIMVFCKLMLRARYFLNYPPWKTALFFLNGADRQESY